MAPLLFPLWQVEYQEYQATCAHLGLTPEARLYERLSTYLASAPFLFDRPRGFSLFLAQLRLNRFRIARLDLTTKLFLPRHPLRHVLNGVIALHECDASGYRQMAATPTGWAAPLSVLGWMVGFALSLAITIPWLCWQFSAYMASAPFRPREDLSGKRVLITGVGRGLGWDLLLQCLEQGAEVIGIARNQDAVQGLQAKLPESAPVKLLAADLSQPEALVASLNEAQIPPSAIDIAILCAGVKYPGTSVLALPQLRDTFQVNLFSAAEFAAWFCGTADQAVHARPMQPDTHAGVGRDAVRTSQKVSTDALFGRARGETTGDPRSPIDKTLVVVSSMGRWHGMHLSSGYNASKAALSIWAESLEMEMPRSGASQVRLMIVEPGIFESGMTPQTGIAKHLLTSRRDVARRIASGALAGKQSLRPPSWFALLTWGLCLGGRGLRRRIFARVNR
jgi:NAD(P)-dependent dehydrogenase (short-subunit alcohol dehydrogenase family)